MKKYPLALSVLSTALFLSTGSLSAADQDKSQKTTQTQEQEQVYGSQLMTQQERTEHRNKMRAAKTAEEREQIRKEHHALMKERAKAKGITLPDEPPAGGMMGQGGGMMGPGGGMGSGGGRGR
jgi:outer membrane PBP1 activator LpoA protein